MRKPNSNLNKVAVKLLFAFAAFVMSAAPAHAVYWNIFNFEGESTANASIVTYATLNDMLTDTNRISDNNPAPRNLVGSGSDGTNYWNVFNNEGESTTNATRIQFYPTLLDMMTSPINTTCSLCIGPDVVGSGSDGTTYWNVFNPEGESGTAATIATYANIQDMVFDSRARTFTTPLFGSGTFLVGSGSDGTTYWNLFNNEGESTMSASFATYANIFDMLGDTNRTGVFIPDGGRAGRNIVGSGASIPIATVVPIPAAAWLFGTALIGFIGFSRRRNVA